MYGLDFYFAAASPFRMSWFQHTKRSSPCASCRPCERRTSPSSKFACFGMKLSSPKIDSLLFAVASPSVLRFGMSPFADASTRQILPVTFSARFRADLEDFLPVEVLAEFAKTGCPVKNVLLTIAFCLAIILPDTNNRKSPFPHHHRQS